ncbi:sigma-E processing peptidase SpoIIGA [Caldicellulosiruptor naganoensis]|uniref:Sigma-E processing peptidase SpoIIGA n=1 Tax=Caldicellulosiruptor naganoensis TaxID=29324 RepID=A0ABY7BG80_9FIRM|nr:sigma-E processing peptidase SpoIIGA [Caldicellulosiruptor naganoensis]WAM31106.1 sigma-E processing peptidase SpoIIGA [Caldicellulosiruptor naganoensis]
MIIYADVYVLENLVINYFILLTTAYFTKTNVNSFRILLGSIIASIYSLLQFYPLMQFLYSVFGKMVVSVLIVYLTFWPKEFLVFLRQLLSFYLVTIMFGGMVFFLYYITKDTFVVGIQIKLKNVLIALGCSLIVLKLSYELIVKRIIQRIPYEIHKIQDK